MSLASQDTVASPGEAKRVKSLSRRCGGLAGLTTGRADLLMALLAWLGLTQVAFPVPQGHL